MMALWRRLPLTILFFTCLIFASTAQARQVKYPPALYTGDFGNCLTGESSLDITRFDVAYDAGNRTLALHLDGVSSGTESESVMLRLSIDAYGANRFDMTFDPCGFNITSLCPLTPNTPITANIALPVYGRPLHEPSHFPFNLPDFEGSARLQIYTKPSNAEISCLQAALTNGRTLSHPEIIAPILGFFTLVAVLASFLTAAYGVSVPHMRMHHAHSLSVLVVFETLQNVFFSGALSVEWPPILTAWWSNFGWSAGFIYIRGLVGTVDGFTGVGGSTGGLVNGLPTSQVFARAADEGPADAIGGVNFFNSSFLHDYTWSGSPVAPGLPLPGTSSGFPATLSVLHIPLADAFMVGLIWLLVAAGLVLLAITGLKFSLAGLAAAKKIQQDRLAYFRAHWTGYLGHAVLRTLVIAFFMTMTLSMLQFTIRVTVGPIAVATVLFILALIAIVWLIVSGCQKRTRDGQFEVTSDRIIFHRRELFGLVPGLAVTRDSTLKENGVEVQQLLGIPFFRIRHANNDPDRLTVHMDESFIKRFGWLTARYRRTRWWFLAYHVAYLFCRAAFLGGGWQNPPAQVYGVLVADVLNFVIAVLLAPFEGARNTVMGVWILGICKIITTGISTAFLPGSGVDRSDAAKLGVAVIVVQGLTVAALLVLIVLGAVSSWLSLMRNREVVDPDWMEPARVRYFTRMEKKARDGLPEDPEPETNPHFSMVSIQRRPKIEDEDKDVLDFTARETEQTPDDSTAEEDNEEESRHRGRARDRNSRTSSIGPRLSTGSLPRAARPYRASWSSRERGRPSLDRSDSVLAKRLSGVTFVVVTDCDASNTNTPSPSPSVKPDTSMWSLNLNTPSVSRASSLRRSSREIEGRRPPTALPEAPEPVE